MNPTQGVNCSRSFCLGFIKRKEQLKHVNLILLNIRSVDGPGKEAVLELHITVLQTGHDWMSEGKTWSKLERCMTQQLVMLHCTIDNVS